MKENKGFTLIELLGTIVLLALIAIIAYPIILNQYKNSKQNLNDEKKKMIINAAKEYFDENENDSCIKVGSLEGYSSIELDDYKEYIVTKNDEGFYEMKKGDCNS